MRLKGFVPQPWVADLDFSTLEKLNVHFVTTPNWAGDKAMSFGG